MELVEGKYLEYLDKPLVREGDTICYGDMSEKCFLILEIISAETIETQEELLQQLQRRGISCTQATISRDINELNIEKAINSNGVNCYMQASRMNNTRFENIFFISSENFDTKDNDYIQYKLSFVK